MLGGGGRGQVNTCPRQRLSYSYDMCTTLGQCELNTVTYQVFGSRSPKKYTKFRLLTAACWVLYAIFLGEKKGCDYEVFNKRAAVPPNHEPNFRPDKTRAEVLII